MKEFYEKLILFENQYPYPISILIRKIENSRENSKKLLLMIELFEILIRLLSAYMLSSYKKRGKKNQKVENYLMRFKKGENYKFSLGFWNGLLEIIPSAGLGSFAMEIGKLKRVKGNGKISFYNKVLKLSLKPKEKNNNKDSSLIEYYMKNVSFNNSSKTKWIEVAKTLVELRNRYKGHGSFMKLDDKEAAIFIEPLSELIGFLFEKSIFLKNYPLINLSVYFGLKDGKHIYEVLELSGISPIFRKMELAFVEKYELGLYFAFNSKLESPLYELYPMALLESCSCSGEDGSVKFLDAVINRKLIYICSNCDARVENYNYLEKMDEIFSKEILILKGMDHPYEGREIILNGKIKMGRSSKADFSMESSLNFISRLHLELEEKNGEVYIKDLSSCNGTFVNGEKLFPEKKKKLKIGDIISLHKIRFQFLVKRIID